MEMPKVTRIVKPMIIWTAIITLILPLNYALSAQRNKFTAIRPKSTISNDFSYRRNANPEPPSAKRKRALLIGISKYRNKTGKGRQWDDLTTSHDLESMAEVLINNFQFDPADIKIISDTPVEVNGQTIPPTAPTHQTITSTFRAFLIEQARPKDIVFFYFAGHGSQIKDTAPIDELDERDETLVPSDYAARDDGSNDIRDDEINELLVDLGQTEPSNVTMAFDSCHSGTATRGDYNLGRGGARQSLPVQPEKIAGIDETFNDSALRSNYRNSRSQANFFFLSAAAPGQLAEQKTVNGQVNGVFTYYLQAALAHADSTTTYRDVYERVLSAVNRENIQQPQFEGDLDKIFLDEGALAAEDYVLVQVNKLKPNAYDLKLLAGALQGMTVGSRFALYPATTKSPKASKPLFIAKINKVWATSAKLEIESRINPKELENSLRAFEISHDYESVLKIALKDVNHVVGLPRMLKSLGLVNTVPELDAEWNVLIRPVVPSDRDEKIVPEDFKGVILQRRNGKSVFAAIPESPDISENIRRTLVSEAKRITVLALENRNPDIKVEIRLIPVEIDWKVNDSGRTIINKVIGDKKEGLQYSKGGIIKFKPNDWYRMEVRNASKAEINLYITILNLDANGKISSPFPRNYEDNLISPAKNLSDKNNGWKPIEGRYVRITEPFGLESLRVIATKEKTDFSPLFDRGIIDRGTTRGNSFLGELLSEVERLKGDLTRGGVDASQKLESAINSPFGQVLIATQDSTGVKGKTAALLPPPSWATATINYLVTKK
jgi:hypothetical protein